MDGACLDKKIIASVRPEETRVAITESGKLVELIIERDKTKEIVGSIYKGKIKNIVSGISAAFIDIGWEQNAFLFLGDCPDYKDDLENGGIKLGQEMLVQVVKDAIGTKGPRVTPVISLPGKYAILLPLSNHVSISKRIIGTNERERLRIIAEKIKPKNMGIIWRTASEGQSETELEKDLKYLLGFWHTLSARAKRVSAPALLNRNADLIVRLVRDYINTPVDEIVVDSREADTRISDLLADNSAMQETKVKLHQGGEEIFAEYDLNKDIEQINSKNIRLECGCEIIIEHTEALTVIDVNTGKFTNGTNFSETIFQTNLAATHEIVRQIRLRDIGGIIIIDYIDMDTEQHKKALLGVLESELRKDRTKSTIMGITALGLVEMTRKKVRPNVEQLLYSKCMTCEGTGKVYSPETVIIKALGRLRHLVANRQIKGDIILQFHPDVAEIFRRSEEKKRIEKELARTFIIDSVPALNQGKFVILTKQEEKCVK